MKVSLAVIAGRQRDRDRRSAILFPSLVLTKKQKDVLSYAPPPARAKGGGVGWGVHFLPLYIEGKISGNVVSVCGPSIPSLKVFGDQIVGRIDKSTRLGTYRPAFYAHGNVGVGISSFSPRTQKNVKGCVSSVGGRSS